jgi:NADH:ubiquinone oxidoreductase subunit F (NADH-binding)
MSNILNKIKKTKLQGRGGGCFPTALKWQLVSQEKAKRKFVVCNASEGEPGVKKDYYLLKKHPDLVVAGMRIAIEFLDADKGYIYINPDYYKELGPKLKKAIANAHIDIFPKKHIAGYVGGEETSALNHIEGLRIEPRLRPPFPPQKGLWGFPTLVNNVETFYNIALIESGEYEHKRFYTISGNCIFEGVYELPEDYTIKQILKETHNLPDFDFFVQVGGDGSGEVLNSSQLNKTAGGSGSITIYSYLKHKPIDLMRYWADFFYHESCGQCTPCREGTKRLKEELYKEKPCWETISDLLYNLQETSFCGLGCAVAIPFHTFIDNVLPKWQGNNITLTHKDRKYICECFG